MKIINKTGWDTRSLRRFFLAGFKAEGVNPRQYTVEIKKGKRVHGFAYYHCPAITIYLPEPGTRDNWTLTDAGTAWETMERMIGRVFIHEINHTQGLRHKDMVKWWTIPVPWADGLSITAKRAASPQPKRDLVGGRARHAETMLARHMSRLKRETALVKRWQKKVNYYRYKNGKAVSQ